MSRFTDLDRPPLSAPRLQRQLAGTRWHDVRVTERTASTNADLAALARGGAPEGVVLVAEEQTAGRGRLDRVWSAPPRSSLLLSVLLRPQLPRDQWGWLPLLTGVAVARALREVCAVEAVLKWPNDVLVGDRKLAGVLAEVSGDAVVIGLGLNVSLRTEELPVATATSLLLESAPVTDRETVLKAVLRALDQEYDEVHATPGGAAPAYRPWCATLGREVRVELPGGEAVSGTAVDVDDDGQLVVDSDHGRRAFAAGDVVHLRGA